MNFRLNVDLVPFPSTHPIWPSTGATNKFWDFGIRNFVRVPFSSHLYHIFTIFSPHLYHFSPHFRHIYIIFSPHLYYIFTTFVLYFHHICIIFSPHLYYIFTTFVLYLYYNCTIFVL